MRMYEARPGLFLVEGVTIEEHERAMAGNWGGPGADDPFEFYEDDGFQHDDARTWVTQRGEHIQYNQLSDTHLKNIVNMLERKGVKEHFPNLLQEAKERDGKA